MGIKGYKVFNPDWTCRGFQYEVGKTFEHAGDISMCGKGFHFCQKASDCFGYYSFNNNNKVAEVEALDLVESEGNKSVTNKIAILREIPWCELLTIVNEGKDCTGLCNTGNRNTGNRNAGDWNAGNRNTGDCNTGDYNTGDWNAGDRNTGDRNTGDRNTGDRNTGNRNTGDYNTGNRNTGDYNTGNWNGCDFSTGFLNSETPKMTMFNVPLDLDRDSILSLRGMRVLNWNFENAWWIYSQNMSDEEKELHPEHGTTGGYLKTVDFKTACKMMWAKLDDEDKAAVTSLPNFDKDVFKEITGIEI